MRTRPQRAEIELDRLERCHADPNLALIISVDFERTSQIQRALISDLSRLAAPSNGRLAHVSRSRTEYSSFHRP